MSANKWRTPIASRYRCRGAALPESPHGPCTVVGYPAIVGVGGDSTPTYETLLADVTRLPVSDRLQLIDAIWDTLPADSLPHQSARGGCPSEELLRMDAVSNARRSFSKVGDDAEPRACFSQRLPDRHFTDLRRCMVCRGGRSGGIRCQLAVLAALGSNEPADLPGRSRTHPTRPFDRGLAQAAVLDRSRDGGTDGLPARRCEAMPA